MSETTELTKTKWIIDPAHSEIGFKVKHLMITNVKGTFKEYEASIYTTNEDFMSAEVDFWLNPASVNTGDASRDAHLSGPDFFDAEKYPTITFKSTGIEKAGEDSYKLTGDLTMHGITKQITMDLLYKGTVVNAMNKRETAGFQLIGTLKRSDFGIGPNFAPPMISDEVRIKADGEFVQ